MAVNHKSIRGVSLIGVIVLSALISLLVFFYIQQSNSVRKRESMLQEQMYAQVHASELLETFRAFEAWPRLSDYLATTTYRTCAHLNILNRSTNTVLFPLPIANVDSTLLKKVNRYVQVRLFNPTTNAIAPLWCDIRFDNRFGGFLRQAGAGSTALNDATNLRVLITVGVSWEASEAAGGGVQEVALSTLLPTL